MSALTQTTMRLVAGRRDGARQLDHGLVVGGLVRKMRSVSMTSRGLCNYRMRLTSFMCCAVVEGSSSVTESSDKSVMGADEVTCSRIGGHSAIGNSDVFENMLFIFADA